jgi:hypothetical protein
VPFILRIGTSLSDRAANILRGPVDAADFKTYVFPLLFFKRISDVFDEEYAAALAESSGDEEYALFPQNYRFQIPKGCLSLTKILWGTPAGAVARGTVNLTSGLSLIRVCERNSKGMREQLSTVH